MYQLSFFVFVTLSVPSFCSRFCSCGNVVRLMFCFTLLLLSFLCIVVVIYTLCGYFVVVQVDMVCRKPDCDAIYLPGELVLCSLANFERYS